MVARLQVEHAKRLMLDGVGLGEIAPQCGYSHQSHFSSRFKQIVGATPSKWLRAERARKEQKQ